jgi:hypothetical protein
MKHFWVTVGIGLLFCTAALAFDQTKISGFCKSNYKPKSAGLKLCITSQTEAAKRLAHLREISISGGQIIVLNICEQDFTKDYASALDCVMRTLDEAERNAAKKPLPDFDNEALCKKVAANVGGSYVAYKTCLEEEAKAKAALQ